MTFADTHLRKPPFPFKEKSETNKSAHNPTTTHPYSLSAGNITTAINFTWKELRMMNHNEISTGSAITANRKCEIAQLIMHLHK